MPEPLVAGIFKKSESDHHPCAVRVCVWQSPAFAKYDPELGESPRLVPLRSLYVERLCDVYSVSHAVVRWSSGEYLASYEIKALPGWLQTRVANGKKEALRIAGGARKKGRQWLKK